MQTTIVIQTDEPGAAELKVATEKENDVKFQVRKVHAQVGDPDTWMFVAQVVAPVFSALSTAILLLIRQRKIKYIKIGDKEFRDITAEQFQDVWESAGKSAR